MLSQPSTPLPMLRFRTAHLDPVCTRDKVTTVRLAREVRHLKKGDALRLAFGRPNRSIILSARCEAVVYPLNMASLRRSRIFELAQDDYIGLEGFCGWLARLVAPLALIRFSLCPGQVDPTTHKPAISRRCYASSESDECDDVVMGRAPQPVKAAPSIHDSFTIHVSLGLAKHSRCPPNALSDNGLRIVNPTPNQVRSLAKTAVRAPNCAAAERTVLAHKPLYFQHFRAT